MALRTVTISKNSNSRHGFCLRVYIYAHHGANRGLWTVTLNQYPLRISLFMIPRDQEIQESPMTRGEFK